MNIWSPKKRDEKLNYTRMAHTLPFMYAPHEHAQHPRHRILSVACPGFLTVPQGEMSAPRASLPARRTRTFTRWKTCSGPWWKKAKGPRPF
jgi:hypothetical protein